MGWGESLFLVTCLLKGCEGKHHLGHVSGGASGTSADKRIHEPQPDLRSSVDGQVDKQTLARNTPGFSGAKLSNLVNEASLIAAKTNKVAFPSCYVHPVKAPFSVAHPDMVPSSMSAAHVYNKPKTTALLSASLKLRVTDPGGLRAGPHHSSYAGGGKRQDPHGSRAQEPGAVRRGPQGREQLKCTPAGRISLPVGFFAVILSQSEQSQSSSIGLPDVPVTK